MKVTQFTIQQIVPAEGFRAVFADEDASIRTIPLACWGLTQRTLTLDDSEWSRMTAEDMVLPDVVVFEHGKPIRITRVEGMAHINGHELSPVENSEFFIGYCGPGENPLDFQQEARDLIDALIEEGTEDETPMNPADEEFSEMAASDTTFDRLADNLPQALSHLSVQVQEHLRKGKAPRRWEQGGWLEFMRRFGDLSGG
jgi:hypothetical protein